MIDRIPCVNPLCRRTGSIEKFPDCTEICCGKCWKLLPKALTARYRQIRRRWTKVNRRVDRGIAKGRAYPYGLYALLQQQNRANWRAIQSYFTAPPAPAGLENFLKENGLA